MKGIWKMLTGKGEAEYRQQHREFREAIPNDFPFVVGEGEAAVVRFGAGDFDYRDATKQDLRTLLTHPAYAGKFASMSDGANYQCAMSSHGPMPKSHDADLQKVQGIYNEYAEYLTAHQAEHFEPEFRTWLDQHGIPLPSNGGAG